MAVPVSGPAGDSPRRHKRLRRQNRPAKTGGPGKPSLIALPRRISNSDNTQILPDELSILAICPIRLVVQFNPLSGVLMKNLVAKLVRDESGGEVLEYALIVGLIVVAAIAAITSVGGKVLARWTSLNSSM
jgi:pilus assembly protein Flp/PilA